MRISLLFVTVLVCSFCTKTTSLDSIWGVITLNPDLEASDTIKIKNLDGSMWYRFSFLYDDSDGEYDFYNPEFNPLLFNPDSYSLAMEVIDHVTANCYEIIVDNNSRLRKYIDIKNQPTLRFIPMNEYVLNAFSVSYDEATNPLLKSLKGKEKLNFEDSTNFLIRPLELSGDWLQVSRTDLNTNEKTIGWIKWRNGRKLLVTIFSD